MKRFTLYYFCNNILVKPHYRQIQTGNILLARSKKLGGAIGRKTNPIGQKGLNENFMNNEFLEDDESELDIDNINFENLDEVYDENIGAIKAQKKNLAKAIIRSKFFSPGRQPKMLTYEEQEKIKFLNEQDPEHWNIDTLSENFPATPYIIKKILKSHWKPKPEKIKKINEQVQKNWELLQKGMLEADPELIKHLKKFVNRREVLYANLSSCNISLPEPKQEKEYNKNEMKNILVHFEKEIDKLNALEKKLLPANCTNGENSSMKLNENPSSLDKLHRKVEKEVRNKGLEEKESFVLGQMFKAYGKNLTFEEFENEVLEKSNQKNLSLSEKAILESKLKTSSSYENMSDIKQADQNNESLVENDKRSLLKKIRENEMETLAKNDEIISYKSKYIDKRTDGISEWNNFEEDIDNDDIPKPDENTLFISSEYEIEKMFCKENNSENTLLETKPDKKPKKKEMKDPSPEIFENVQKEISGTVFWNSGSNSDEKRLAEHKKSDIYPLKTQFKISESDKIPKYPQKINIPKNQRGSGLTFKVKDCYYDDDGQFLYRVPGMVN